MLALFDALAKKIFTVSIPERHRMTKCIHMQQRRSKMS